MAKLTEKFVAALPPPPDGTAQTFHWDSGPGAMTGFGVVVGRQAKTFVVRGHLGGKGGQRIKATIGQYGAVRPDGAAWTVQLARGRAQELLGQLAAGINPNAKRPVAAGGPTLQDALDAHVARMTKRGRSERSIKQIEREVTKYWAAWLDQPIAALTGEAVNEIHEQIKANAKPRANAVNIRGAAQANRAVVYLSACWNSLNQKLGGKLGTWNPAKAVDRDSLVPKRVRVADLADWHARVQTMRNPVQRDGLLFALFTGLRSEDVRTVRWEHFDSKRKALRVPDPKGGEARAFEIPLGKTCLQVLKRREKENPGRFPKGDHGWVFPGESGEEPIPDLREQRFDDKDNKFRFPTEDVHSLRRTYESVAHEIGISELDLHVLTNHAYASHNVNATYIAQHFDHLATCQTKIDAAISKRLRPPTKKAARAA